MPPIAIVGAALRFPGAADPASFHELTVMGRRMFPDIAQVTAPAGMTHPDDSAPVLAAETAAAALRDVPMAGRPSRPGRIGVVIAADASGPDATDVAGRVYRHLGLAAPGTPLTASACSLRAIATACDLLNAGELDLVLAGGVAVDSAVGVAVGAALGAESALPAGAFASGGCGVISLTRAADAHSADLPVYAEIIGWHAAGGTGQQTAVINGAYLRAGVDPADVQLIDGHGAATAADDLTELTALLEVLAPGLPGSRGRCAMGVVSASIGNARSAAGVAAVLKTALAMTAGTIPPTTGRLQPHQLPRAVPAPFRLVTEPEPWPVTGVRLAAVNSLGTAFPGGSRTGPVHVVLRREHDPGHPAGRRRRAVFPEEPQPDRVMRGAGPESARPETVVAIRGTDRDDLAVTLDTIAITATRLSGAGLLEFAAELATAPAGPDLHARAAILASDPGQLAERARNAAAALRTAGQCAPPWTATAGSGVYLSEGARGRVALLFPGLASTGVEHSAVLSASMATLAAAERLGVKPSVAVGYSFGEITGLAWAGAITFGEAARFAAHRAEIISATSGRAAMARVFASRAAISRLCEGTGLAVAARESPAQHVLAGSVADIRDLPPRAAALGAEVDVLSVTHALHSPAMLGSVPPLRAAADGLRFTAPRRRLVSTVTGLDLTGQKDTAALIAGQLARPALLADALELACADADLLLVTARDPALARVAGDCGRVPVVQAPIEARSGSAMSALAAFFAARAVDDLRPFLSADAQGGTWDRSGKGSQAGELAARA